MRLLKVLEVVLTEKLFILLFSLLVVLWRTSKTFTWDCHLDVSPCV